MREIDALYERLDSATTEKLKEFWAIRYAEIYLDTKGKKPKEDTVDELAELYITGLLSEPNENTHYAFETEILRKRDRAAEAVNAVNGKSNKLFELERAMRIYSQMTGWYVDFSEESATLKAYKDCGVKKVKRHEQKDAKTCQECRDLDGEIYPVDNIPPLPHLHCRRWFTPA